MFLDESATPGLKSFNGPCLLYITDSVSGRAVGALLELKNHLWIRFSLNLPVVDSGIASVKLIPPPAPALPLLREKKKYIFYYLYIIG